MSSEPQQILENLRRLQSLVDILSWIASRFDKAVDALEKQAAIDDIIREQDEYLNSSFDRIDKTLLLILERLQNKQESKWTRQETNRLRAETIKSRLESLRKQLKQYQGNLNWLEEQEARYGAETTLQLTNQLIATKEKIGEIDEEVKYLEGELKKAQT